MVSFFLYIVRRFNYCRRKELNLFTPVVYCTRFRIVMNLDFCCNYGIILGLVSWFLFVWFWFLPSFEWFRNRSLFIVSKQCACSRRVHIEGHMNRFEYCHPTIILITIVLGLFLSKNRIFCSITRC